MYHRNSLNPVNIGIPVAPVTNASVTAWGRRGPGSCCGRLPRAAVGTRVTLAVCGLHRRLDTAPISAPSCCRAHPSPRPRLLPRINASPAVHSQSCRIPAALLYPCGCGAFDRAAAANAGPNDCVWIHRSTSVIADPPVIFGFTAATMLDPQPDRP
jgi:hypothetical protein